MFSTVPSAPIVTVIGGDGAVVIWDTPEMPKGIIVEYELRFTRLQNQTTVATKDQYYVPYLEDIPQADGDTVTEEVSNWNCFNVNDGALHEQAI